ncbi:hypothetical protein LENED_008840 [Lentinula edodes]|uniref:Uncharacterized protein n=1 Tax=Lentinula edodes TaxID=5353 RepID=A0A1Q3EI80_LENED|nr:hypothetical protein LENED_008840 [Lentinula edodes]
MESYDNGIGAKARKRMRLDLAATKRFLTHAGALPKSTLADEFLNDNLHNTSSNLTPKKAILDKTIQLMQEIYRAYLELKQIHRALARCEPGELHDTLTSLDVVVSGSSESQTDHTAFAGSAESNALCVEPIIHIERSEELRAQARDKNLSLSKLTEQLASIDLCPRSLKVPSSCSSLPPQLPPLPLFLMPPDLTTFKVDPLIIRVNELKHWLKAFKESSTFTSTSNSDRPGAVAPLTVDSAFLSATGLAPSSGTFQSSLSLGHNYGYSTPAEETAIAESDYGFASVSLEDTTQNRFPDSGTTHVGDSTEDDKYKVEAMYVQLKSIENRMKIISHKQNMLENLSTITAAPIVTPLPAQSSQANPSVLTRDALELVKRLNIETSQSFTGVQNQESDNPHSRTFDYEVKKMLIETLVKNKLHELSTFRRLKSRE